MAVGELISHETLASPLGFGFHTKAKFVAGSIQDPLVQPFALHMCAGHPLGWLCGPIVQNGLDIPSFFQPWGGEFQGSMHPARPEPTPRIFRNSRKCTALCGNGMLGLECGNFIY